MSSIQKSKDREREMIKTKESQRSKDNDKQKSHLSDVKNQSSPSGATAGKPSHHRCTNSSSPCEELARKLSTILSSNSLGDVELGSIKSLNLSLDGDDDKRDSQYNTVTNRTTPHMTTANTIDTTRMTVSSATTQSATPSATNRSGTTRSATPIAVHKTPSSRSATPSATNRTSSIRSATPSATNRTASTRSDTPSATNRTPTRSDTPSATNRTPSARSATPLDTNRTPSIRSATPSSTNRTSSTQSATPTATNRTSSTQSATPTVTNRTCTNKTATSMATSSATTSKKKKKSNIVTPSYVSRHLMKAEAQMHHLSHKAISHMRFVRYRCHFAETENNDSFLLSEDNSSQDISISSSQSFTNIDSHRHKKSPGSGSYKCSKHRSMSECPKSCNSRSLGYGHCKHSKDLSESEDQHSKSKRPVSREHRHQTDRSQSPMPQECFDCECSKHQSKCPKCHGHVHASKRHSRHKSESKKCPYCSMDSSCSQCQHDCSCNPCQYLANRNCDCMSHESKRHKDTHSKKSEILTDDEKQLCTVPLYYCNVEHGIGDCTGSGSCSCDCGSVRHQIARRSCSCNARCPNYWHEHSSHKHSTRPTGCHCCCNHYCGNRSRSHGRRSSDLNTEDVCRHRCSHGTVDSKRRSDSKSRHSESHSTSRSSRRTVSKSRNDSHSQYSSHKSTTSKSSMESKNLVNSKHRGASKTPEHAKRRPTSSSRDPSKSSHKRDDSADNRKGSSKSRHQSPAKEKPKRSSPIPSQTGSINRAEEKTSTHESVKTVVTNETARKYVGNFKILSSSTPRQPTPTGDLSNRQPSDSDASAVSIGTTNDLIARCESMCRHIQNFVNAASKKKKSNHEEKSESTRQSEEKDKLPEKKQYYYLKTRKSDSSESDTDAISVTPMDHTEKMRNYEKYVKMYDEQLKSSNQTVTTDEKPLENNCKELADPTKSSTYFIKAPTGLVNSDLCIQETHQRQSTLTERTTTSICKLACTSTIAVELKTETVAVAESSTSLTHARRHIVDNRLNEESPQNTQTDVDVLAGLPQIRRYIREMAEKSPERSRYDRDLTQELPQRNGYNSDMIEGSHQKSNNNREMSEESPQSCRFSRDMSGALFQSNRYDSNMTKEIPKNSGYNRDIAEKSHHRNRYDLDIDESSHVSRYNRHMPEESPHMNRSNRDTIEGSPQRNSYDRDLTNGATPKNGYDFESPPKARFDRDVVKGSAPKNYNDRDLTKGPRNGYDFDMANESPLKNRFDRQMVEESPSRSRYIQNNSSSNSPQLVDNTSAKRIQIVAEKTYSEQGLSLGVTAEPTYMRNENCFRVKEDSLSHRVYFDKSSNRHEEYYDEKSYEASIPSAGKYGRMNPTETLAKQQQPLLKTTTNMKKSDSEDFFYDAMPDAVANDLPTDRNERPKKSPESGVDIGKPPLPGTKSKRINHSPQENNSPPEKERTAEEWEELVLARYHEFLATQKHRRERTNVCRLCDDDTALQVAAAKAVKKLKHLMKYPMELIQSAVVGLVPGMEVYFPTAEEVEEYNKYNQIYKMNGRFFYDICRPDVKIIVKKGRVYVQETGEDRIFRIPMLTAKPNIPLQRKLHSMLTYELEHLEKVDGCPCMVEVLMDVLIKCRGETY